ncbi:helix-turn-helix domain-containing protein [Halorubrum vacuolatum]|uniref:HTH DNA binding domain-containing protein n=1 Tax=Halorubrum vacuolatum TaxID=63740 RepID=A0A238WND2_HALVU|nr:helix-turn-helix domain-containing protein [Halorubrum vacuolatum]SNR47189.1 HTH DNA binding domain-containing protein [Halorubrum vacuolatum]
MMSEGHPTHDPGNPASSHGEHIRMSLSVSDPEAARELLVCLGNAVGASVSVDCVTQDDSIPCSIPVNGLTERQVETAVTAVERGYYDVPQATSLSELSEEFGVTNSAISQRLRSVERTLVRSLVETARR